MLLSKQIAVNLNLISCKLKQYTAFELKVQNIDLTPEQFLLIDILWNQGTLSQQTVADLMHKDKNSITKLVDALEKKGLVMRQQDRADRRSNLVKVTEEGEKLKNKAKEVGIYTLDQVLDGITEEELNTFLKVIYKMSDNMDSPLLAKTYTKPDIRDL